MVSSNDSLATNLQSDEFKELKHDMYDDVGDVPLSNGIQSREYFKSSFKSQWLSW